MEGKVYNITKLMQSHSGGGLVLMSSIGTGKDAIDDFDDADHSAQAKKDMK